MTNKPFTIELNIDGCEFVSYASTWDELQSALRDLSDMITIIMVSASGEILYDARDGWDIVTKSPPHIPVGSDA